MIYPNQIKKGETVYEEYYSHIRRCNIIEFNYRSLDGTLFTCGRQTLDECKKALNKWLNDTNKI